MEEEMIQYVTQRTYLRNENGNLMKYTRIYLKTGLEPYIDDTYNLDYRPRLECVIQYTEDVIEKG